MSDGRFGALASRSDVALDELALALAAEFRDVDEAAAFGELDRLADLVAPDGPGVAEEIDALRRVLGEGAGFAGDPEREHHPDESMLDLVLERRRGLPILLSTVWIEVARRAEIAIAGVGLPGHYVVGHFGTDPAALLDPYARGASTTRGDVPPSFVRPWSPAETALRMLNNLIRAYTSRGDLARAIRAAEMRLMLPVAGPSRERLEIDLRTLRATLN